MAVRPLVTATPRTRSSTVTPVTVRITAPAASRTIATALTPRAVPSDAVSPPAASSVVTTVVIRVALAPAPIADGTSAPSSEAATVTVNPVHENRFAAPSRRLKVGGRSLSFVYIQ